jgi:hypothetical protein
MYQVHPRIMFFREFHVQLIGMIPQNNEPQTDKYGVHYGRYSIACYTDIKEEPGNNSNV